MKLKKLGKMAVTLALTLSLVLSVFPKSQNTYEVSAATATKNIGVDIKVN